MQAVSRLYGRRIRGDIGPLNTDPARRLPGRILGPAVSLTGYYQDYDEASDVQHFTLGSRMQVIGGRVFYYARVNPVPNFIFPNPVGLTILTQWGVKNPVFQTVNGLPGTGIAPIAAIAAPGAIQVEITVVATDGYSTPSIPATGAIGLNALVGGHIIIWPLNLQPRGITREIVANTATSVATTLVMTVTLDRPLPVLIPAGSACACMASEYAAVQTNDQWNAVLGLAMVPATAGQYIWLQTWGTIWMSGQLTIGEGLVIQNNRQVVFRADGSLGLPGHLDVAGTFDPNTHFAQHAGYVMVFGNNPLYGRGAPFVFLQITP